MNAGRLKEVITIQKPTISQNEYGANGTQWTDYITTRSDVQFESGNRDTENGEIVLTILRYSLLGIIITQMKRQDIVEGKAIQNPISRTRQR